MNIREIRKKKGMTIRELSELSKISYHQIQCVETGKIKLSNMTVRNFFKLCSALEIEPCEIYGDEQ